MIVDEPENDDADEYDTEEERLRAKVAEQRETIDKLTSELKWVKQQNKKLKTKRDKLRLKTERHDGWEEHEGGKQ